MAYPVRPDGHDPPVLVSARAVSRAYGEVEALVRANMDVRAGEIHGLVGENGAGKSTFARVLAGIERPDQGIVDGPARRQVAIVPQQPAFAPNMTVWEQLIVGSEVRRRGFLDRSGSIRALEATGSAFGISIDLRSKARSLTSAEARLAAILAALVHDPHVLVLDEPTVGLAESDRSAMLHALQRFRDAQRSVVFISHDFAEVAAVADLVTPIRQGSTAPPLLKPTADAIAGAVFPTRSQVQAPFQSKTPGHQLAASSDNPVFSLRNATLHPLDRGTPLGPINLDVWAGEILSVVGLRDSGIRRVEQFFLGESTTEDQSAFLGSKPLPGRIHTAQMWEARVGVLPSDRIARTAAADATVMENAMIFDRSNTFPRGLRRRERARQAYVDAVSSFSLAAAPGTRAGSLSGGMLHKLVLGRVLGRRLQLLVAADPSAGLDRSSLEALSRRLREQAKTGTAVLLITSRVDVACALGDRVHVIYGGQSKGAYDAGERQEIERAVSGIGVAP